MCIDNFALALDAFDAEMDRLAKIAKNMNWDKIPSNGNWVSVSNPPYDDKKDDNINTNQYYDDDDKVGKVGKTNDVLKDVKQVIFNDPATIVTFSDGSKVCVKASKGDKFSKEVGLVYALIKRLYANDLDENGYMKSKGLGEKLTKLIEGAIDQKKIAEDNAKKKAEKKAKKAAAKKNEAKID